MTTTTAPPEDRAEFEDPAERWAVPAIVEAPGVARWVRLGEQVSQFLGMRTAGWLLLGVALVLGVAGALLRWQELRLFALASGLILVIALACTIGRAHFRVELSVPERRVVVGQPAAGHFVVINPARRRCLPARLDLPIGAEIASFQVPSLAAAQQWVAEFTIPTERRGVLPTGPARSVQGDPFGLAGRESNWTDRIEVFVHPRTVSLTGRQTGFIHDLEGHTSARHSNSDINFQSLREYTPGDDRRQVHWRSTARMRKLMVRQFEETLQSRVALGIDLALTSYLGEDDFETAISVVGSLALRSVRDQNPLSVFTNRQSLPAVSGPRVLDELSRLERRGRTELQELANTVVHQAPQASVVMLATGAGNSLDRLRRACATFDLDTRVVGIVVDPGAGVMVRNVANVSLVRLAQLSELERAMRRAMPS